MILLSSQTCTLSNNCLKFEYFVLVKIIDIFEMIRENWSYILDFDLIFEIKIASNSVLESKTEKKCQQRNFSS